MSEIRKFFTSRYKNGRLLELDFSQLEVFVLAYLSNDPQLRQDLIKGEDLHAISATQLFGANFTPKQRKIAKGLSFQLQYGSGYKNMAKTNGVPDAVAKQFIENYYDRYQGVKIWQDAMLKEIDSIREPSDRRTKRNLPSGKSEFVSLTGRRYTFYEHDAPDWMREAKWGRQAKEVSFSPTQIKNYPVQGFATADIVPLVIGKLYRELLEYKHPLGKVLMVNTVHDSVVFDCETDPAAKHWAAQAKACMESAPRYLKEVFDIDFDLPLRVEAEIGYNWHDMKRIL